MNFIKFFVSLVLLALFSQSCANGVIIPKEIEQLKESHFDAIELWLIHGTGKYSRPVTFIQNAARYYKQTKDKLSPEEAKAWDIFTSLGDIRDNNRCNDQTVAILKANAEATKLDRTQWLRSDRLLTLKAVFSFLSDHAAGCENVYPTKYNELKKKLPTADYLTVSNIAYQFKFGMKHEGTLRPGLPSYDAFYESIKSSNPEMFGKITAAVISRDASAQVKQILLRKAELVDEKPIADLVNILMRKCKAYVDLLDRFFENVIFDATTLPEDRRYGDENLSNGLTNNEICKIYLSREAEDVTANVLAHLRS